MTTLAYRRKRTDIIQVYRIVHQIDKIPFEQFFTYNTRNSRGHEYQLEKPFAKNPIRYHSFSLRTIDLWNKLPSEAVLLPSDKKDPIIHIKSEIEKAWKDDPIKYDFE